MIVKTKIISFDSAREEIEHSFRHVVKQWLENVWKIMESRIIEEDLKVGLKELLDSLVVTSSSPSELDSSISWGWQVSEIETIGGGSVGRLTIYVADTTCKFKENEGIVRSSATLVDKTLHFETEIIN